MATLLIGYDTEAAAVGEGLARFIGPTVPQYRAALDPDVTRRGVALLSRLHRELDAPCTFFVCGRTLLHAMDAIEPLAGVDLFDIQQHTYSHVVFRDVRYRAEGAEAEAVLPETPAVALREELRFTSDLIRRYLGRECVGLRTPFGHYRGLRGRPDLLEIVRDTGHRFVSSWGRNEENGNPTPWVQPFAYEEEGFPDLLEIPFQFWLDGVWFDLHGYGEGVAFGQALRGAIDEIAEQDLVFATAFHEWCAVEADEEGTGWIRTLIEHARRRGVELLSYAEYWARTAGRIASTTTSPSTMTGRSSR
ncbi:MAG TPA: polysaccharide deacetylase family protein [Gaiellaceae bacterium]|jgi:peptidoglycan/xylan/chitin deacetylase (PgdA/CDA1 family)|nr:polysaccharide deacetylase family protein [Gaiellaceae bacterium]